MDPTLSTGWIVLTIVHLAATAAMAGLMATIHYVHYPTFAMVDAARYAEFQQFHMRRISRVLLLPWGLEGATAAALVLLAPTPGLRLLAVIGAAGVLATVAITAFRAAPAHGRLLDGFDPALHRALLRTDGLRTAIWFGRLAVALALVLGRTV